MDTPKARGDVRDRAFRLKLQLMCKPTGHIKVVYDQSLGDWEAEFDGETHRCGKLAYDDLFIFEQMQRQAESN